MSLCVVQFSQQLPIIPTSTDQLVFLLDSGRVCGQVAPEVLAASQLNAKWPDIT
jgi:hypothetical protein